MVANGQNGYLVPVGDVNALAQAIADILEYPGKSEDMGRLGRATAVRDFSSTVSAERFFRIYEELAGSQGCDSLFGQGGRAPCYET
jgi:glycosyltransferase involved in cell wall biosynthesis